MAEKWGTEKRKRSERGGGQKMRVYKMYKIVNKTFFE